MSLIGCYIVTHAPSGRYYVGSSADLHKRRISHESNWRTGCTNHPRLLEAYRLTNSHDDMKWEFFFTETRDEAYALEQAFLDKHWGDPNLLNATKDARAPIAGITMTDDILRRRYENFVKVSRTPEYRAHQGKVSKLRWDTDTTLRDRIGGKNHAISKPLMADGTRYDSAGQAAKALGLYDSKSVCYRIRSPHFPGYFYIDDRPVSIKDKVY